MAQCNVGSVDRVVRVVVSIALIYLGVFDTPYINSGVLRILLGGLGLLNLLAAATAFCPVYYLANLSTCARSEAQRK